MLWLNTLCSNYGHCFMWGVGTGITCVAVLHASPLHG